jgi:hypothetical protein
MSETDYTEGDGPVPIGALIEYFGSEGHGRYRITKHDSPDDHPYRQFMPEDIAEFYPDGVAYELWPVGVPRKFGNRDRAVYYVRRKSFRVLRKEKEK